MENGEENMAETAIETAVQALIDYAVAKSLITEDDEICVRNYLMDMLKLEKREKPVCEGVRLG